ncbi:MAG: 23S rRNA (uracil(1939)-C(5))-methyltransferase RlmD [Elusimicrobia bacterium]|nr:23S rRNA (uracil(1939)-C(5))-methyltransferase RlmD [Elusimicrobiota bacterium]
MNHYKTKATDKNGRFTLSIDKLVDGGDGLAFNEKTAVFVPLAVPGDLIEASWENKRKSYGFARIERIIKASPERTQPPCPLFAPNGKNPGCGGCQWQMAQYAYQLKAKKAIVGETFERIAKIPPGKLPLEDCVGMEEPWHYRNKVQYPLGRRDKRLILGYYARNSHNVIDLENCPVELPIFDAVLPRVKKVLAQSGCPVYEEARHDGLLRYCCLRGSQRTNELLFIVVARQQTPASFGRDLAQAGLPGLVGIVENVNPKKTNIIYGSASRALWGRPYYHEKILNKTYRISATSFFQTNTAQAEKIIDDVIKHLPGRFDVAVDAYSGVGLFTLFLAERAKQVIAIEEHPGSYEDARINGRSNGHDNIEWQNSRVENRLPGLAGAPDLVFLDPPRQGLDPKAAKALINLKPKKIVYLSCDPKTQARDIGLLADAGYTLERLVPFDLFPHTYHIETLAYLASNGR